MVFNHPIGVRFPVGPPTMSLKNTMDYWVYMLKSTEKKPVTYVGHTKDLKNRLKLHNAGKGAKFTRGREWAIIYKEKFKSKKMAISREYFIKNNKKIRKKIKERRIYE